MKSTLFGFLTEAVAGHIDDTIVVAGPPRSGTTWLAELLRELPGQYKFVNEPLHLGWNSRAREAGFGGRTRIHPQDNRPALKAYMHNALRGNVEHGPSWQFRNEHPVWKLQEHVTHHRLVVKFCRAGRMLHWMADRFPIRQLVVTIRHPCAVIASMLNMGDNWQPRDMEGESLSGRFGEIVPDHIADKLRTMPKTIKSWVGHLAIGWSLDYYFAFHEDPGNPCDYPWLVTCYERLLTERKNELERIVSAFGGTVTESMRSRIGEASSYASSNFQFDEQHQLRKWKAELSEEQIEIILSVAKAFNLDFYTKKPLPDYDRLFQFQDPSVRPTAA